MVVQKDNLILIAILSLLIVLFILFLNRKLAKYDPLSKPQGIVWILMLMIIDLEKILKTKINEKVVKVISPIIVLVAMYILMIALGYVIVKYATASHLVGLLICALILSCVSALKTRKKGE